MRLRYLVASSLVVSCSTNLELTEEQALTVSCLRDADCPHPYRCQTTTQVCTSVLDVEPPSITSAGSDGREQLTVLFSEPMAPTLGAVTITPSLGITAEVWSSDHRSLRVFTAPQTAGLAYRLELAPLTDEVGNSLAAPTSIDVQGFTPIVDPSPPDPVAPTNHARLFAVDGPVVFAWTARAGATTYVVEVATTADFQTLVGGTPRSIEAPSVSVALSGLPSATTLYWRVRLGAAGDAFVVRDFDLLGDIVYVRCGDSESCSDGSAIQNGTPTRPFRTIGGAVSVALAYAERVGVTPTVRVASRAAGYDEAVEIVGGPLDLLGGWASDFATRDPVGNATRVSATSTALRAIGVTQPVTVDGFDWVASAANLVRAVDLIQVSDTLTLRNCTATADAQPNGSAVALGITGVSGLGPRLEDLTLTASDAPAALGTTGLDIKTGCARATNLTIVAGGSPTSTGVRIAGPSPCDIVISDTSAVTNPSTDRSIAILVNDQNIPSVGVLRLNNVFARAGAADVALGVSVVSNAVAVIDASTAIAGAGVDESYALSTGSEGRVVARDSVFRSLGATTGTSMGVYLRSYASTLVGNTLAAGDATGGSFALYLDDSNYERHVVRNNIFATHSATGICVRENYRSEIASFESNAMLVCSTLYNLPVTATSLTTTTAVNALDNTPSRTDGCPPSGDCHHRRVNGTAAGASAWTTYFVDPNGANGDPNDDFRLLSTAATATLRSGGKDPAGTDCGVHEVAEPCNGTAFDRVGTQRDAPFSIGAFETP